MEQKDSAASFRRLSREDRRAELLRAAVDIAFQDGLARVTARRIAARADAAQSLVMHYFKSVDEILAAVFEFVSQSERDALTQMSTGDPLVDLRLQLGFYLSPQRDPAALLWLDAWRESAHRPAVREVVIREMEQDVADLKSLIAQGKAEGLFPDSSPDSAMRVLALIDGLAANAAVRAGLTEPILDYANAIHFVVETIERELGTPSGALAID